MVLSLQRTIHDRYDMIYLSETFALAAFLGRGEAPGDFPVRWDKRGGLADCFIYLFAWVVRLFGLWVTDHGSRSEVEGTAKRERERKRGRVDYTKAVRQKEMKSVERPEHFLVC